MWSVVNRGWNVKCYKYKSELAAAGLVNVFRGFCNTLYDLSALKRTILELFLPLVSSLYRNKDSDLGLKAVCCFVCGQRRHCHFLCFLFATACLFRYNVLSFVYLVYLLLVPLFAEPTKTTMQGEHLRLTSSETDTCLLWTDGRTDGQTGQKDTKVFYLKNFIL